MESVSINLISIDNLKPHIHNGIECILVIKGNIKVIMDNKSYLMSQDDFIVINPNTVHTIDGSQSNILLSLYTDFDNLKNECGSLSEYSINCVLIGEANNFEIGYEIKSIFTKMLIEYLNKKEGYELNFHMLFLRLMNIFYTSYKGNLLASEQLREINETVPIGNTLKFIDENYNKHLTLEMVAEREYMTPQYFSSYFKRKVGVGFLTYLQDIRLEHAIKDLVYTNASVLQTALQNGFSNAKAFTNAVKKKYNQTPGQYREKYKAIESGGKAKQHEIIDLASKNTDIMEFMKYIKKYDKYEYLDTIQKDTKHFIDAENKSIDYIKTIDNFVLINSAKYILYEDAKEQLIRLRTKLGINTIYFPLQYKEGIAADDDHKKYYDLYKALNFMYEEQFVPFISIRPYEECVYFELSDFNKIIEKNIQSYLSLFKKWFPEKYITQWIFEIGPFINLSAEQAKAFYKTIYKSLRLYLAESKIGMFAVRSLSDSETNRFKEILDYGAEENIQPDFLTFNSVANEKKLSLSQDDTFLDEIKNYHNEVAEYIIKICHHNCKIKEMTLYMTIWNTLTGYKSPEINTYFRTALIIDNLIGLLDCVKGCGYWFDTFMCEEGSEYIPATTLALNIFNRIPRPVYHALDALNRINKKLVYKADCIIAAINENDELVILIWNPRYLNPAYSMDNIITKNLVRRIEVEIKNMPKNSYYIKQFTYNQENSGALGRAANAGFPGMLDMDTMEYYMNSPGYLLH